MGNDKLRKNDTYHLSVEEELEIIDLLCNGIAKTRIAQELGRSDKTIARVYNKYKQKIQDAKKDRLMAKRINKVFDTMLQKKSLRMEKMDRIIDSQIQQIVEDSFDGEDFIGLASGDESTIMSIYFKEQKDLLDLTKINDTRQRNIDTSMQKEKDIILKLQELKTNEEATQSTKDAIDLLITTLVKED